MTRQFIDKLENLAKEESSKKEFIQAFMPQTRKYQKSYYLKYVVGEARDFLQYNEWLIALENTVDNLYETDIKLDVEILDVARMAFGERLDDVYASMLTEMRM